MRIFPLIFLSAFAIFPLAHLQEDEQAKMMLESLRKSLDGLETDRSKIHWDELGFRVEEKNWQEKAGDWLNILFEGGGTRQKRDKEAKEEGDPEELIRVNAKIVFYKNGTRMVDIENGPLIEVDPKGRIWLDYRNGTRKTLGGQGVSRNRRFATLEDLYMAHGFEFEQKEAADFRREMFGDGQKGKTAVKIMERAEDSSSAGEEEGGGGEWQWARGDEQKNGYWDRPLYGTSGGEGDQQMQMQKIGQNGQQGMRGNNNEGGQQQQQQQQQQQPSMQQFQQPAAPPKSTIWETFETPSKGGGAFAAGNAQNGGKLGELSANNAGAINSPIQGGGQSSQPNLRQKGNAEPVHPPSPSPSSWLQSQLHSQQPLSPEELELAKELMRRIVEQEEWAKGANTKTNIGGAQMGGGTNGGGNGQTTKGNGRIGNGGVGGNVGGQQQNVGQQNGLPKWAQPKAN